jgi:hypothetical protein
LSAVVPKAIFEVTISSPEKKQAKQTMQRIIENIDISRLVKLKK